MKTIYKYQLDPTEPINFIEMHDDCRIISAKEQHCDLCIWAEVDTNSQIGMRKVYIVGTGQPLPTLNQYSDLKLRFIDTVVMAPFVWHVYTEEIDTEQ